MNLFRQHQFRLEQQIESQRRLLITPRLVTVAVQRPNPALLGTTEERNAFADEMLRQEREREANVAAGVAEEVFTEGRRPRHPFHANPHD